VLNSLGAGAPVASTLQYLQRALQAPVALQEVISSGPLLAKLKSTLKLSSSIHHLPLDFSNLKKIMRRTRFFAFHAF
jgi:hypothetical protein